MRVGFQLQVDPDRIAEYEERHRQVWPRMLAEITASGRRNYTIFLRPDGLLFGYFEVDDPAASAAYLAASEVAAEWEAESAGFFTQLDGRPDQGSVALREVFHLD
ncbi:MAG: rhaM [Schumannella sp.]|nr:rhaM [Schumannella sp.]